MVVNFVFQILVFLSDTPADIPGKQAFDEVAARIYLSSTSDIIDAKFKSDKVFWDLFFPIFRANP